ncbi:MULTISPECIES: DUF4189 domain-containing protein [unclassified Mycobacterium]|uniref:DUF4189 domain-containing protein n=1 Tax=unclassified Mycobacterium TaxID=2642494 RepID=UPI0029C8DBBB|nr:MULTISPECIES: DUF4189 domain-containing protein [unclassified Mycobacterium]
MTATEHTVVTTTHQKRRARGRIAAAMAAGAVAAGALGTSSAANAYADYYVALAYSFQSDVAGLANNQTDSEQARFASLKNCQDDNGGNHCIWYGSFSNECAALAVLGAQDAATATAPDLRTAEQKALAANPGGRIVASGCARTRPGHGGPITAPTHTMVPLA